MITENSTLKIEPGHVVKVGVESYVQQTQLAEFKEEATLFIRKQLNNFSITINSEIKASTQTKNQTLTNQQKFDLLANANPALLKLKEQLFLEINH